MHAGARAMHCYRRVYGLCLVCAYAHWGCVGWLQLVSCFWCPGSVCAYGSCVCCNHGRSFELCRFIICFVCRSGCFKLLGVNGTLQKSVINCLVTWGGTCLFDFVLKDNCNTLQGTCIHALSLNIAGIYMHNPAHAVRSVDTLYRVSFSSLSDVTAT